jgi:hypothetical protein
MNYKNAGMKLREIITIVLCAIALAGTLTAIFFPAVEFDKDRPRLQNQSPSSPWGLLPNSSAPAPNPPKG